MEIGGAFPQPGETTGRTLVLFEDGASAAGMQTVQEAMSLGVAEAGDESAPASTGVHYFESLGVAVVDAPAAQVAQAGISSAQESIAIVEPERIVYALEAAHYDAPTANGHEALPQPDPAPFRPPAPPQSGPFSAEYLRGYREAVLHLTAGIAAESASVAGVRRRARRVAGDVGPAGHQGRQLLPDRARHPPRRARHRLRRHPPGLRRAHDREAVVRGRRGGHGRPRPRHALHRHVDGRQVPAGAAALRHRPRGRDLRGQGAVERGLGRRRRHPGRHRVGAPEPVRRDLHVARRGHAPGPEVLPGVRARRQAGARRRAR